MNATTLSSPTARVNPVTLPNSRLYSHADASWILHPLTIQFAHGPSLGRLWQLCQISRGHPTGFRVPSICMGGGQSLPWQSGVRVTFTPPVLAQSPAPTNLCQFSRRRGESATRPIRTFAGETPALHVCTYQTDTGSAPTSNLTDCDFLYI